MQGVGFDTGLETLEGRGWGVGTGLTIGRGR